MAVHPVIRRSLLPLAAALLVAGCGGEKDPPSGAGAAVPSAAASGPAVAGAGGAYVVLDAVPDAGTVSGTIRLEGPVPKLEPRQVTSDHASCGGGAKPNLSLALGKDRGLARAVVRLEGIARGKRFDPVTPTLDQRNCVFEPYLQLVPRGMRLTVLNSDPVSHTVHAYGPDNVTLFNVGTPVQGSRDTIELPPSGPVKLRCDVHTWMFGWVYVAATPYTVISGPDGQYRMTDVPPGSYQVAVWHELLGEKKAPVTVAKGGAATVDLSLSVLGN